MKTECARSAGTEPEANISVERLIGLLRILMLVLIACIVMFVGCSVNAGNSQSSTLDSARDLYSYQYNFSKGTTLLNIIPVTLVQDVYDNYDELQDSGSEYAPISLREYAVINTVYLDYDTDCSIVWNKDSGEVYIEQTVVADREEYKQKQHKTISLL